MATCDECGARSRDGATCRQQWDELLALEFSDPRAVSVHFLTVACYQLQHPVSFPLTAEARRKLADALRDVIVHARPVATVRDAMHQEWDGSRRVRDTATRPIPTVGWSAKVADVGPPDPERHAERVQAWAAAVLGDLERHEAGGSMCGPRRADRHAPATAGGSDESGAEDCNAGPDDQDRATLDEP